ncbi:ATP-binding protein [Lactobacillus mulieris]|jgi:phage NTP-binding protein|uniref:ATP-binding protein n=4 Tax=root TaxID=1 RepID=A0AAW5WWJ9_9LACO|nr:ATP-binding protein [Lactobacillus mulieris]EEU21638.1 hypothetical protein HMPREF0525_00572 [Lactobacillus jensenii 27-2-CHN]EEX24509.1 hypothetical protein HMPREF0974_00314 [Lactobacillus jensenii 115-3-CHN]TVU85796.1 ATP-binding protein [Lactobacillus jensenii]DAD80326.1 MAG TPA: AAA domain protein [Siphoviridae sp. ctX581]MCF1847332.1 ATP-binding protein [Lactobacillus mulieris]
MGILPKDEVIQPKSEPHNFFIYGAPLAGKSFFASHFPHPLILNTDGNALQQSAPSIQIRNIRSGNSNKPLKQSAIEQLTDIITELETTDHTYKTLVVDVIDDICVMMEQAICLEAGVTSLADLGYGRGYAMFNSALQQFVVDLKALPMDIIFISRELEESEMGSSVAPTLKPSLKKKYYNIVAGNCDVVIHLRKLGPNTYLRKVDDKRMNYKPENISNERVLQLLESCRGMFSK